MCTGATRWPPWGPGPSGAHSLCRATACLPLSPHPASFWRQLRGPDPCDHDRLPHQLTRPRAGPRGQMARVAGDGTFRHERPASCPWSGGREDTSSPSSFQVGPAAPGWCSFGAEGDLCNLSSGFLSAAPEEASKAQTAVTGSLPVVGGRGGARIHFEKRDSSEHGIMMKGRVTQWEKSAGLGFEARFQTCQLGHFQFS